MFSQHFISPFSPILHFSVWKLVGIIAIFFFRSFSLVLRYNVSRCGFLLTDLTWDLLSFLNLNISILQFLLLEFLLDMCLSFSLPCISEPVILTIFFSVFATMYINSSHSTVNPSMLSLYAF